MARLRLRRTADGAAVLGPRGVALRAAARLMVAVKRWRRAGARGTQALRGVRVEGAPAKMEEALADAPGSGFAGQAWPCQRVAAHGCARSAGRLLGAYEDEPGSACLCY